MVQVFHLEQLVMEVQVVEGMEKVVLLQEEQETHPHKSSSRSRWWSR